MKTLFSKAAWGIPLAAVLGGAFSSEVARAASSPVPPEGVTWDVVFSGAHQAGIAYLTFATNFTFSGYELRSIDIVQTNSSSNPRGSGSSGSRGDSDTNSTSGSPVSMYGITALSGPWDFDAQGRVIGSFTETLTGTNLTLANSFIGKVTQRRETIYGTMTVSTNIVLANVNVHGTRYTFSTNLDFTFTNATFHTNVHWTSPAVYSHNFKFVNTNHTVEAIPQRFTLVVTTPAGKMTGTGVPAQTNLTELEGRWYGQAITNGVGLQEFFWLTHFPGASNLYTLEGSGPGYTNTGWALLSSQKKLGFSLQSATVSTYATNGTTTNVVSTNGIHRATLGSFTPTRRGTNVVTKGIEEPGTVLTFKATWQSP